MNEGLYRDGVLVLAVGILLVAPISKADDADFVGDPREQTTLTGPAPMHVGSSPFAPPEPTDSEFVVDDAPGLDTGCVFSGSGPLVFDVEIDRYIGSKADLLSSGLLRERAKLLLPAFDVDFNVPGLPSDVAPERNRVLFNGNVVDGEYLTGSNNTWKLNAFEVPIDWVQFPTEPGSGGRPEPVANTIEIHIDVANAEEYWCTQIDWASLRVDVARPVVMAHGILSSGSTWDPWVPKFDTLGLPNSNDLDMGDLDSIAENAGKIADEVATSKESWGVDRVHLVAHSKGGIDSRHYAEGADDVEQLIQLGTPNAGSPLADAAQTAALRLTGPLGATLINSLAGPAGIQLTTDYMELYNQFHGGNPNVRYTAVAGDYDPGCLFLNPFCRPVKRLLLAISGEPGDTIVPVWSAHALGYSDDRIHSSWGDDHSATHSGIHANDAVFDSVVVDRISAFSTLVISPDIASPAHTASVGGSLQAGASGQHAIPVDSSGELFVSAMYPSGELVLELISPDGAVIDAGSVAAHDQRSHETAEIPGGMMQVFSIGDAEIGEWTVHVEVVGIDGAGNELPYAVNAWMPGSAVVLTGGFEQASISSGEPMVLRAQLDDAEGPLADAEVAAIVVEPDGGAAEVNLNDDGVGVDAAAGDGIYSGELTHTGQPGMYRVRFEAAGLNRQGVAFSRQDFGLATVSAGDAGFTGTFVDYGVDQDGNGLYDQLVIEGGVNVDNDGSYRIMGVLEDSSGNRQSVSTLVELQAGEDEVQLAFGGRALYRNGVDGPYNLAELRIAEEDPAGIAIMPTHALEGAHATAAYGYDEFEHAPLLLTGQGSAQAIDLTGDGRYDRLDVSLEARIEHAGFYQWSARLVDEHGTELGFSDGSANLDPGDNMLTFSYDGEAIGANGVDGPYHVSELLLFGAGESLVAGTVFHTQAFQASEFAGFVDDTDGDGIPDGEDACINSDLRPTVVIDDCDSEVGNVLLDGGCSISDRIMACAEGVPNHGQFVRCVAHLGNELVAAGIISGVEKGQIQHCAAQSSLP